MSRPEEAAEHLTTRNLFFDALGLSSCFLLIDLIKVHRSSAWTALTLETTFGVLVGELFYSVILFAGFMFSRPLLKILRIAYFRYLLKIAIGFMVFAAVVVVGEGLRPAAWVFVAAFLAIYWCLLTSSDACGIKPAGANTLWLGLVLIAAVAIHAFNVRLYAFPNAEPDVMHIVALWTSSVGMIASAPGLFGVFQDTKRRRWLAAALGALLAGIYGLSVFVTLYAAKGPEISGERAPKPNLLLITTDAMRADWCGVYGGPAETPAMEAFAGRGVLFENAYSLGPWTLPSMFGMFASQIPPVLTPGAGKDAWAKEMTFYRFDKDTVTLATQMRKDGYATAAYVGNTLLRDPNGILRGFGTTRVVGHRTPVHYGFFEALPLLQGALLRLGLPVAKERPIDSSAILAQSGESFLSLVGDGPFFLWIHFMDPHGPYAPPDRFAPEGGPWPVYDNADPHWGTPLTDDEGRVDLTGAEKEHVRALYRGEISYVDYRIGQVLDRLDALGLTDSTYVCMTSDHGEEFWDHGEYGHGQSLYNELTRVPFIISGPDIAPGRITSPISALDLMPTLAELTDMDVQPDWLGESLAPVLRDKNARPFRRPVYAQGTNLYASPDPLRMTVLGDYKLIVSTGEDWRAFYDLGADPNETVNLLDQGMETPDPLNTAMEHLKSISPPPIGASDSDGNMSEELEDQLRGFGYLN